MLGSPSAAVAGIAIVDAAMRNKESAPKRARDHLLLPDLLDIPEPPAGAPAVEEARFPRDSHDSLAERIWEATCRRTSFGVGD
jgi:hypothetical protein